MSIGFLALCEGHKQVSIGLIQGCLYCNLTNLNKTNHPHLIVLDCYLLTSLNLQLWQAMGLKINKYPMLLTNYISKIIFSYYNLKYIISKYSKVEFEVKLLFS